MKAVVKKVEDYRRFYLLSPLKKIFILDREQGEEEGERERENLQKTL